MKFNASALLALVALTLALQLAAAQQAKQITVMQPAGLRQSFYLQPSDTVGSLKNKIAQTMRVPRASQRLYYSGWELTDDNRQVYYDVNNGAYIILTAPHN